MNANTKKSKSTVQTLATITYDTNPANLTPFALTIWTDSWTRTYSFDKIVEAIYLTGVMGERVKVTFERLPW